MIQDLAIPERRISVLLGKQGKTKQKIEKITKTKISINSCNVHVSGNPEGVITASQVVKAVGRGFTSRRALLLLEEDNQLNVISLDGETEKTIKRLLSRVIGREGRAKKYIEKITGCFIVVYGKTVSIIGNIESINLATTAVEDLLAGRKHGYVYAKIEKMKRR